VSGGQSDRPKPPVLIVEDVAEGASSGAASSGLASVLGRGGKRPSVRLAARRTQGMADAFACLLLMDVLGFSASTFVSFLSTEQEARSAPGRNRGPGGETNAMGLPIDPAPEERQVRRGSRARCRFGRVRQSRSRGSGDPHGLGRPGVARSSAPAPVRSISGKRRSVNV
jgi:hypothetical protein